MTHVGNDQELSQSPTQRLAIGTVPDHCLHSTFMISTLVYIVFINSI